MYQAKFNLVTGALTVCLQMSIIIPVAATTIDTSAETYGKTKPPDMGTRG
jgi:hypothetical protein